MAEKLDARKCLNVCSGRTDKNIYLIWCMDETPRPCQEWLCAGVPTGQIKEVFKEDPAGAMESRQQKCFLIIVILRRGSL